jgi:hypothetical protein
VFDIKSENFDRWEIQWNAFVEVEGISGTLGNVLDTNMHDDATVLIMEKVLLTSAGKSKTKA